MNKMLSQGFLSPRKNENSSGKQKRFSAKDDLNDDRIEAEVYHLYDRRNKIQELNSYHNEIASALENSGGDLVEQILDKLNQMENKINYLPSSEKVQLMIDESVREATKDVPTKSDAKLMMIETIQEATKNFPTVDTVKVIVDDSLKNQNRWFIGTILALGGIFIGALSIAVSILLHFLSK